MTIQPQIVQQAEQKQQREPEKHRITVDEYYRMGEAGIFTEDDRVELLEGDIYDMASISSYHAACVGRLTAFFTQTLGQQVLVWIQNPLRLDHLSEPEPDVMLLKPREDYYAPAHPGPGDVHLLIEVAYTSQVHDRERKLPLYARFGVPEVWIVDIEAEQIDVYREPQPQGYKESRHFWRGDSLAPATFPNVTLTVDEILG